jgi:hypothetical protein
MVAVDILFGLWYSETVRRGVQWLIVPLRNAKSDRKGVFMFILEFILNDPIRAFAVGPLLAVAFYGIQLLLCRKAKHLQIKLIPLYLFLALFVFLVLLYMGVFPGRSEGLANAHELAALILAIAFGIPVIGVCAAWMVYRRTKQPS